MPNFISAEIHPQIKDPWLILALGFKKDKKSLHFTACQRENSQNLDIFFKYLAAQIVTQTLRLGGEQLQRDHFKHSLV